MTDTQDTTGPVSRESAAVPTAQARRYLGQLCKHFAHKLPVTFDEIAGTIPFASGTCHLVATDAALTIDLEAPADGMEELRDVVTRHLDRFAFREELVYDWHPIRAPDA
jgi:hypothetical protein